MSSDAHLPEVMCCVYLFIVLISYDFTCQWVFIPVGDHCNKLKTETGAAKSHTDRLERVQHKFVMWLAAHVYGAPQTLEYSRLISYFSLCSLSARRAQHDLMFLARIFTNKIDSSLLRSYFGLAVPCRPTRQLTLFAVPYARVETVKRGMFCRLPRVTNEFLCRCFEVDIFNDSFHCIKSRIRRYVKM